MFGQEGGLRLLARGERYRLVVGCSRLVRHLVRGQQEEFWEIEGILGLTGMNCLESVKSLPELWRKTAVCGGLVYEKGVTTGGRAIEH